MFDFALSAWTIAKLAILAASLMAWLHMGQCFREQLPILTFVPRRTVPWGLLEIGAMVLILFGLQLMTFTILRWSLAGQLPDKVTSWPPDSQAIALGSFSLATLIALLCGIWLARRGSGATGRDLGLCPWQPLRDVWLGFTAFAVIFFPVFFLQFILTQFFETRHPLIELLRSHPSPLFLVMSGVSAVLIAPVVEEYFFRVFVQGWFENLAAHHRERRQSSAPEFRAVALGRTFAGQHVQYAMDTEPSGEVPAMSSGNASGGPDSIPDDGLRRPAVLPIIASSLLFALAHYDHGPDPIPLFVLAGGLGYLYQRTHRVLPCIAVHFCVNLFTMIELTFYLYGPPNQ